MACVHVAGAGGGGRGRKRFTSAGVCLSDRLGEQTPEMA